MGLFDKASISRRNLLKAAGVVGVASMAPAVFAQGSRTVKFTLPWLAQGATAYMYVAQDQGMFKKRGIDIEISRGYGSLAAGQAIANKQFDFGLVSASSTILCAANGLPLVALGTTNYEAYLGLLVRTDSPIKAPADVAGKKMGGVPASVEFPCGRPSRWNRRSTRTAWKSSSPTRGCWNARWWSSRSTPPGA